MMRLHHNGRSSYQRPFDYRRFAFEDDTGLTISRENIDEICFAMQ